MFDVQCWIKWKIVQQVLGDRCKEKTLIFKMMVDLATKRNFLIFLHTFQFSQFSREKKISRLSYLLTWCQNHLRKERIHDCQSKNLFRQFSILIDTIMLPFSYINIARKSGKTSFVNYSRKRNSQSLFLNALEEIINWSSTAQCERVALVIQHAKFTTEIIRSLNYYSLT